MRLWMGAVGAVVACVAVGGVVGYAVAGTSSSTVPFTPAPISASPTLPVDLPSPYAPDPDYPPLSADLSYVRARVGPPRWSVQVPRGWAEHPQSPPGTEVWQPPDEPPGGYQVRVEPLAGRDTPADKVQWQEEHMPPETTVEHSTGSSVLFDYRDQDTNRHRYDFFAWVRTPGTAYAGLEISVAGRKADVAGLKALLSHVRRSAVPVPVHPAGEGPSPSGSASGSASGSPSESGSASGSDSASASSSAPASSSPSG